MYNCVKTEIIYENCIPYTQDEICPNFELCNYINTTVVHQCALEIWQCILNLALLIKANQLLPLPSMIDTKDHPLKHLH